MEKSQDDLVNWFEQKAEEYMLSAELNLKEGRLFPAAEELFKSVETSLEALLYLSGIKKIEKDGNRGKFTGRLALQFLIRDNLLARGKINQKTYNAYLEMASDLHSGGYEKGKYFDEKIIKKYFQFAEDLLLELKSKIHSKNSGAMPK